MKKYERAEMEVIEFEAEDVITTSCDTDQPIKDDSPAGNNGEIS